MTLTSEVLPGLEEGFKGGLDAIFEMDFCFEEALLEV